MDYAGVIIENKRKEILLQHRDNKPNILNPNKWGIFGGGIEKGEFPFETAIRELNEELNLKVNKKDLKLILKINLIFKKYFIFRLKINSKKKLIQNEGQAMGFFSRKQALKKKNLVFLLRIFLWFYPFFDR